MILTILPDELGATYVTVALDASDIYKGSLGADKLVAYPLTVP
jgi:hypothetical protein